MKLSSILLFVVAPALIFARYTPNHQSWRHANKGQRLLGILKKRTDFHLGVALDSNIAQESQQGGKSADLNCLKPNMDLGVQTYEFKWDPIEKDGLDHWNTKPTDEMVSWLHGHGKLFRGHCGIWDQSTPQWVQQLDGPQNREKLKQALYNHIYKIVTRYGHQMIAFDVINEPFDYSSKGTFKNDVFWRNLGYDMFVIAFQAANKAKRDIGSTHLKLYINELGIEGSHSNNNQKRKAMMSLIDKLRQLHVQFDGIGLQGHFTVDDFPEDLAAGIKLFTDKGLETSITELDIRIRNGDNSEETLNKQARQYAAVYQACLQNPSCKMVVRWGVNDDRSWIPQYFPGWGRATMFGSKCQPKPKILHAVTQVLAMY